MAMKKASKGKRGCLTRAGKLKKGWRWSKGRKGYCVHAKKAAKKKRTSSAKRKAAGRKAAATRKARAAARMLMAEGQSIIGSQAMDGW